MKNLSFLVCLMLVAAAVSCSDTPAAKPDAKANAASSTAASVDAKKLFEDACSACHKTAKVEGYAGSEAWKSIVDRMIDTHKAKITPENATTIVAYLDKTFPRK